MKISTKKIFRLMKKKIIIYIHLYCLSLKGLNTYKRALENKEKKQDVQFTLSIRT